MQTKSFTNLVKDHFRYLVSDFGFSISEERPISEKSWSAGHVIYASEPRKNNAEVIQLSVWIILDRGYVNVDFVSSQINTRDPVGLSEIMHLVAPDVNLYEKVDFSKQPIEEIEPQIRKLSHILLHYCASLLQGDISLLQRVIESRKTKMEEYIKEWKQRKK